MNSSKYIYIRNILVSALIASLIIYFFYYQVTSFSKPYIYYDPEIPYMMNSLSVFKGYSYAYIDHPGTPIQIIGSLLLLLTYPFTLLSSESFINFHLMNPMIFLLLARLTLLVLSCITIWQLARHTVQVKNWRDVLIVFIIVASYFAAHPDSLLSLTLWSHNSFNFSLGTLLLLKIWILLKKDEGISTRKLILIGLLTGMLTAFQLYLLTWVIGALISFSLYEWYSSNQIKKAIQTALIVGFSSLGGFFLATIPIIKRYPQFFSFVTRLATHDGLYGGGEKVITTPARYFGNLYIYTKELPVLFLGFSLTIAALYFFTFFKKIGANKGIKSFTAGLMIQILVTVAIILKHPMTIYFLSIAAMFPLLVTVLFEILNNAENYQSTTKKIQLGKILVPTGFLLSLFLLAFSLNTSIKSLHLRLESRNAQEQIVEQVANAYAEYFSVERGKISILWTYETNSYCYGMWFGNHYTEGVFTSELTKICKNNFQISLWSNLIETQEGFISPEMYHWDFIVLKAWIIEAFPNILGTGTFVELNGSDLAVIVPPGTATEFLEEFTHPEP